MAPAACCDACYIQQNQSQCTPHLRLTAMDSTGSARSDLSNLIHSALLLLLLWTSWRLQYVDASIPISITASPSYPTNHSSSAAVISIFCKISVVLVLLLLCSKKITLCTPDPSIYTQHNQCPTAVVRRRSSPAVAVVQLSPTSRTAGTDSSSVPQETKGQERLLCWGRESLPSKEPEQQQPNQEFGASAISKHQTDTLRRKKRRDTKKLVAQQTADLRCLSVARRSEKPYALLAAPEHFCK